MDSYKKKLMDLSSNIDGATAVCPFCKSDLDYMDDKAHCCKCGRAFPEKNGILCFGTEDEFYEGKFTETKDWSLGQNNGIKKIFKTLYRSISIGAFEARFLQKQLKEIISNDHPWILDFGCGGGAAILPEHGYVAGVDLSVSSLLEARSLYSWVYQIDGEHLPFSDASFDCVYTSHVFGHIPLHQKSRVISEIYRVLKPGGYLLSSIECDSESIVYKRAKKHPALFSKCYVEQYGHYGLELPDANFKRFRKAGFLPVVELADIHKGYLRPVTSYKNLLAYKGKDAVLFSLGAMANWIEKSHVLTWTIDFVFGLLIPVSFLFTPQNHRDSAKIVYQKPK
ncbi:MAG: methyltransferase domain-containing protein [Deltaproteobacteria bacterium]|nr:methyltransferase domain-containing protein [Deltaproteobacteria bacterium]